MFQKSGDHQLTVGTVYPIIEGRNPKQPVEFGSLPHHLQGFSTIQRMVGLGIS